ncbi:signal peptide peptidase SppA [Flammeovirga sp. MY04]|uniref:signal peptide peptidase SppA n=1 Tax=Flammeovirga sp. MY04 TaxID=1191459 RepID=UPI0008063BD8|nr:signal peptide peptidase SppA [Flammeovirga sp. MY04]ANQ48611.1 signal peptide peptidase SppA [Flammeovirga sp. MY04]
MKGFLKTTLAVIVGVFISSAIIFLFSAMMFGVIIAASSKSEPSKIDPNSVLVLDISKSFKEIGETDPFEKFNSSYFPSNSAIGIHDFVDVIDKAAKDDNISGIYLKGGTFGGSMPMAIEVREALEEFKSNDKFVWAYADGISEAGYYVISESDKIFLNPHGGLEFNGLSSEIMYYKKFFEKIGVEPEVFRVGKYKSAVEPFLTDKMSDANREQITSYLNNLYNHYLEGVAASRGLGLDEIRDISNNMKIRNAKDALHYNFVDELVYVDQVKEYLAEKFELESFSDVNTVGYSKYKDALDARPRRRGEGKIAILSAEGEIIYGKKESGQTVISNKDLVENINDLAEDDDVSAVVLRVNSPGGSALSSDLIWRAIEKLKEKKPVVASMSTYAASGGYYISAGCDKIIAYPNTITGSIGIFGLAFNPSELVNKKLGLQTYAVSTGKFSNFQSVLDDFSEEDRQIIQASVEEGYETFTSKVAQGRKMKVEDILKIAQGRVWTGEQAKEVGLVDELGGIDKAIEIAASLAELENDDYQIEHFPGEKDFLQEFLTNLDNSAKARVKTYMYGEYATYMDKTFKWMNSMKGVQASIPYYQEIEGFERP